MKFIILLLTIIFILLFSSMCTLGAYMVYQSSLIAKNETVETKNSDVKIKISEKSLSFDLTNATPGLLIFCFGAIGLILTLVKIPVREILGYKVTGGGGDTLSLMMKEKLLSDETIDIPLLIWWVLVKTGKRERINTNAKNIKKILRTPRILY